jgi:hypothetical protein
MGDRSDSIMADIKMTGFVTVTQGDTVIVREAKNHFTTYGMQTLINLLNVSTISITTSGGYLGLASSGYNIYIGTNISVQTTPSMTALNAPIGTTPGTVCTIKTQTAVDGATNGIWGGVWSCAWAPGTVSGTVGEMALYLVYNAIATTPNGTAISVQATTTPSTQGMYSRLSVADGDFNSFVIDTSKPLTVDWKILISYT